MCSTQAAEAEHQDGHAPRDHAASCRDSNPALPNARTHIDTRIVTRSHDRLLQVRHCPERTNGLRQYVPAHRTQRPVLCPLARATRSPLVPSVLCAEAVEECKYRMSRYGVTPNSERVVARTRPTTTTCRVLPTDHASCLCACAVLVLPPQMLLYMALAPEQKLTCADALSILLTPAHDHTSLTRLPHRRAGTRRAALRPRLASRRVWQARLPPPVHRHTHRHTHP